MLVSGMIVPLTSESIYLRQDQHASVSVRTATDRNRLSGEQGLCRLPKPKFDQKINGARRWDAGDYSLGGVATARRHYREGPIGVLSKSRPQLCVSQI